MKITDIKIPNIEITSSNYENIFSIHEDGDGYYYFNLLKKVHFPDDLSPDVFDYYATLPDDFYTIISYKAYGTIKLWWLVCAANNIDDPTSPPNPGTIIKLIKPNFVPIILSKIANGNDE